MDTVRISYFGQIVKATEGKYPDFKKQKLKLQMLILMIKMNVKMFIYNRKLFVRRKCILTIMHMAHDSNISGHFTFAKTMAQLANFYWRYKAKNVKKYIDGCRTCQQYKDNYRKQISEHFSLEMSERIGGSLDTYFIVHLLKTKIVIIQCNLLI